MRAYAPLVSMDKLFALLVAIGVLLAPAFTRAGEAFAAVPDHHAQMLRTGHCEMPSDETGKSEQSAAKTCCMSMCMAVTLEVPRGPGHELMLASMPAHKLQAFQLGAPPEIATPPPRRA